MCGMWGVGVSLLMTTIDFCHAPALGSQKSPNVDPSVNEVDDPGGNVSTVHLE